MKSLIAKLESEIQGLDGLNQVSPSEVARQEGVALDLKGK
jgi:hypothetical protein